MSREVGASDINAAPTKSFFVSMLTRDITLEDAILDLLDNCIDGINRLGKKTVSKPYGGFWADIKFDATSFSITDNCGGIPWDQRDYAFRMGRPSEAKPVSGSVGVYGIGMKRAIFKIGKRCTISTRNGNDQYTIEITPQWLENEDEWNIDVSDSRTEMGNASTIIKVNDLYEGIASRFAENEELFGSVLKKAIATHYAHIIDKGFKVTINQKPIKPKTISVLCDKQDTCEDTINPFVYKDRIDGVDVYLAVGLKDNIPSETMLKNEIDGPTQSSENAGWTVLCNDRAVLYCDRTELTGWGETGVPRYHTQFISISGVVEFRSDDSSKLPTTTTKRGLDASSPLYLKVKNKMREGLRIFTAYTNKWKGKSVESQKHIKNCRHLPLNRLEGKIKDSQLRKVPHTQNARQYKPRLPVPSKLPSTMTQIKFDKDNKEIETVAEYLDDPNMDPNEVGSRCFDLIHDETEQ